MASKAKKMLEEMSQHYEQLLRNVRAEEKEFCEMDLKLLRDKN